MSLLTFVLVSCGILSGGILATLSAPNMTASKKEPFYIGTYTSPGGSKGIYRALLDVKTGELSGLELAATASNPSYLAIHPHGKFLYAVHEENEGSVSAYSIQADGMLGLLGSQAVAGAGQCHVSTDPAGKNLFTASYNDGVLDALPIHPDGRLGGPTTIFRNTGRGPDADRQTGPHMHAAYSDPEGRVVYACDLGTDEILMFHLDAASGKLVLAEPRGTRVTPGGGPRHLAFHPSGMYVYVNSEMANRVTVFTRDSATGALGEIQTISTLPDGEAIAGKSTAEIECHPNGKWLYVSNRGDNTIAVFSIQSDGRLVKVQIASTGVRTPRGFSLDPTGHWLVVGGQDGGGLAVLALDRKTGKLAPTGHELPLTHPVCILFPGSN